MFDASPSPGTVLRSFSDAELCVLTVLATAEFPVEDEGWAVRCAMLEVELSDARPISELFAELMSARSFEPLRTDSGSGEWHLPAYIGMAVLEEAHRRGLLKDILGRWSALSDVLEHQSPFNGDLTRFRSAVICDDREASHKAMAGICSTAIFRARPAAVLYFTLDKWWDEGVLKHLQKGAPRRYYLLGRIGQASDFYAPLSPELIEVCLSEFDRPEIRIELAINAALRGHTDLARKIEGLPKRRAKAGQIAADFAEGEHARVLELGRSEMLAGKRYKYPELREEEGVLFALSCMVRNDVDPTAKVSLESVLASAASERPSRFRCYARIAATGFFGPKFNGLREGSFARLEQALSTTSHGFSDELDKDWLDLLVDCMALQWTQNPLLSKLLRAYEDFFRAMRERGVSVLTREFDQFKAVAEGRRPEPGSLAAVFRPVPVWERKLDSLLTVPNVLGGQGATVDQIQWRLEFARNKVGIHARLVRGDKGGRGRKVSLQTLLRSPPEPLAVADRRVIEHLKVLAPNWRFDSQLSKLARTLGRATLPVLIDHPRVANEAGESLTVVRGTPELKVRSKRDGTTVMAVEPKTMAEEQVGWQLDQGMLYVYEPDDAIIRFLSVVPDGAIEVPSEGESKVREVLQGLAPLINISGTGPVGDIGVAVEPSSALAIELQWNGQHLDARVMVMPLGASGPRLAVGKGSRGVLAKVDDELRSTQRSLPAERRALAELAGSCPTAHAAHEGSKAEAGDELGFAYEILAEVHDAQLPVFWNSAQRLKVPSTRDATRLRAKVRAKQAWLEVQMQLEVDEARTLDFKAILDARIGQSRFLKLSDGEMLALSKDVARRLDELSAVGQLENGRIGVHNCAVPVVASALEGLGKLKLGTQAKKRLERFERSSRAKPRVPSSFRGKLRSYQKEGFVWMARLAQLGLGACLADDMGLGKTVQTLALCCRLAAKGPILIVAPTAVARNWLSEAERFAPELRCRLFAELDRAQALSELGPGDLLVCSYGIMAREHKALAGQAFAMAVFDEGHALKNASTQRAKASRHIDAGFRLALTGTPIENHLGELWSLMTTIVPGLLGTEREFDREFAGPISRGESKALAHLRTRLRPFILRRHKSEVLDDLPDLEEIIVEVSQNPEERAFYEALRRRAVEQAAGGERPAGQRMQILAEITRLRRAAVDPRLVDETHGPAGAKIEAAAERLAQLHEEGHRALVFSQFLGSMKMMSNTLKARGIEHLSFDGSTPTKKRAEIIEQFQSGSAGALLISLKAGGTGINLTSADYVFHLDPWWNPAVEDQATARAHRMGQTRNVTAYRFISSGTIEEKILDLHESKRALSTDLLANLEKAEKLSIEQLRGLLA